MGCAKNVALLSFSVLAAAAVLLCFTLSRPDIRVATLSLPETTSLVSGTPSQTSFSGELTHRDAGHLEAAAKGSPFFSWHEASNQVQAQRAYWQHLMGRTRRSRSRRQLLGTAVQTLPINGTLETGNYFVTMGLGTPAQNITLLVDSGSSLFWVECNDCADCTGLTEQAPFLPSATSTLTTPSCNSCQDYEYGLCGDSTDHSDPSPYDSCFVLCAANAKQCYYGYSYGDASQTGGYIQKDVLTVPSTTNATAVTANVSFGCNYLSGTPSDPTVTPLVVGPDISGLIGLSKGNYSVLNQMAAQNVVAPVFSFCLAGLSGGGLFVLGNSTRTVPGMQYVPMGSHPEYYNATILSISVNNQPLSIPASVFYQPEVLTRFEAPDPYYLPDAIFDSGTAFTILADEAYQALAQQLQATTPSLYRPVEIDSNGYVIDAVTTTPSSGGEASPPSVGEVPVRRNASAAGGSLCFEIPTSQIARDGSFDTSPFPNITFAFSGATLMVQPNDYLFVYQATDQFNRNSAVLACPTFISDQGQGDTIIGEFTMRNHYMVFDTQARRIGIAPTNCTTFR